MLGTQAVFLDLSAETQREMELVAQLLGMSVDRVANLAHKFALPGISRALSARDPGGNFDPGGNVVQLRRHG